MTHMCCSSLYYDGQTYQVYKTLLYTYILIETFQVW